MKSKMMFVALFAIVLSSCGPTIYIGPSLESSKSNMKVLAILPFSISIDSKRLPKGMTVETLKESEQKSGYDMQSGCYTWLLQRSTRYTVTFQDVDRTNALLKKAGISYDDIALKDKGELCKLLGVNGLISGKGNFSKPMSEGGAIAMTVLVGYGGSTNKMDASLTIHDDSGGLLWKYDYAISGSLGSSAESVAKSLMKKSSRKFPYTIK
jgi:hypothetical protein